MHGNLEPEESVWNTYPIHPEHQEMLDVDLDTEELLSVSFDTNSDVDVVFTPDQSFKDKIREYFYEEDDDDGDIVIRT